MNGLLALSNNLYCSFIKIAVISVSLQIQCLRLDAMVVVQLWLKPRDHGPPLVLIGPGPGHLIAPA